MNKLAYLLTLSLLPATAFADTVIDSVGRVSGNIFSIKLVIDNDEQVTGEYSFRYSMGSREGFPVTGTLTDGRLQLKTASTIFNETFEGQATYHEGKILYVEGTWTSDRELNYAPKDKPMARRHERDFIFLGDHNILADRQVDCFEMETFPDLAFESGLVDLGSGSNGVDSFATDCSRSIMNLEFMTPLFASATRSLGRQCSGTLSAAVGRHYQFSMARKGFMPDKLYKQGNFRSRQLEAATAHFDVWGLMSTHNYAIYRSFMDAKEVAEVQLKTWYQSNYSLSDEEANAAVASVVHEIQLTAYGVYSESQPATWALSPTLVEASDLETMITLRRQLLERAPAEAISQTLNALKSATLQGRGETPLSLATYDPAIMQVLLEKSFDANYQNEFGKTALYYAIEGGNAEVINLLLEHGADINAKYNYDENAEVDCRLAGMQRTPLMHAAQHASEEVIDLLIEAGADLTAVDRRGWTMVDYAKNNGRDDIAAYLSGIAR